MPKQKDSLYFGMSTSDNPIAQAMRNNPFAKLQKKMAANPHFPSAGAKPKKQSSTGERSDSSLSKKPFANYIDSLQNSGKPNYPDRYTIGGGESRSKDSVSYKSPLETTGDNWVKGLPKPVKKEPPKSLFIADKAKNHLVTITNPDSLVTNNRQDTISAKEAYKRKVQWFAPGADNYWQADSIDENIKTNPNVKHFSSKDILDFAKKNKKPSDYRSKAPGDWKVSKEGADGYLISEVDGYPYYSDGIGQIPFAYSTREYMKKKKTPSEWVPKDSLSIKSNARAVKKEFQNALFAERRKAARNINDEDANPYASMMTETRGMQFGGGELWSSDTTNNYDNSLIRKTIGVLRRTQKGGDTLSNFREVFKYPVNKISK